MKHLDGEKQKQLEAIIIFFSATGNTKKIAGTIQEKLNELNVNVTRLDITSYQARREKISFNRYDAVFFGFPVYSLRAPRVCREWIERQNGEGKKCSVFFTYGGFGKEPAHYYIKELLESCNFTLVSTAEFLSAHTFNYSGWESAEGRPNKSDLEVAEEYTTKTLERFLNGNSATISEFKTPEFTTEQLDQAEKYRFNLITQVPARKNEKCSLCMLCEKLCPTNSMNAVKGVANSESCIACFSCIANCPENVLGTNDISGQWENKLKMHNTTKEEIDKLRSKIFL